MQKVKKIILAIVMCVAIVGAVLGCVLVLSDDSKKETDLNNHVKAYVSGNFYYNYSSIFAMMILPSLPSHWKVS